MGLYFLLYKYPKFLGPSQKIKPKPGLSLGPSHNFAPNPLENGQAKAKPEPGLGLDLSLGIKTTVGFSATVLFSVVLSTPTPHPHS